MNASVAEPSKSVFEALGARSVINCCGIYTDLGGSVISPQIWEALEELNTSYVRMTDLLDSTGEMVARMVGSEAARITPSASAAIALAVAATMTGDVGERWEQLPDTTGLRSEVVISACHLSRYKYAVCARMPGATLRPAGSADAFDLESLEAAITERTACVFVPAHLLDGFEGVDRLAAVARMGHACGVPLVVDAAYMVYPTGLLQQYHEAGADLVCFSAKYFGGPNSGGFVAGRRGLIGSVTGLDFTRFESGRYRGFGRAFKMSRYDVAATALALEAWLAMDHGARWASYAAKVQTIARLLEPPPGVKMRPSLFTMSEELVDGDQVNCLVLEFDPGIGRDARAVQAKLEAGDPIIATIVEGSLLIVAVDALLDGLEAEVGRRLAAALS